MIKKIAAKLAARSRQTNRWGRTRTQEILHWAGIVLVIVLTMWALHLFLDAPTTLNGIISLAAGIFNGYVLHDMTKPHMRSAMKRTILRKQARKGATA